MKSISQKVSSVVVVVLLAIAMNLVVGGVASAATVKLSSEENPNHIYELQAKVAYLTAFIDALREGEQSPAPTYVVTLKANMVSLIGTVARDSQTEMVEICGPKNKGIVSWGDGTFTPLLGLGCSGDVHTFAVGHEYEESGSYRIVVTDLADRTKTHVVRISE